MRLTALLRFAPVGGVILSAYERSDSPFVRIQYADATGKKRFVKTNIRKTDPEKELKVAKQLNAIEAQLLNSTARSTGGGWQWVPGWLRGKYAGKPATLQTYEAQWRKLALFLRESGLHEPGSVTREDCYGYVPWRTQPKKRTQARHSADRQTGVNTTINELKLLGLLLDEAMARGLCASNPARKLGLSREDAKVKPEMTDDEIRQILRALKSRPEWMQRSFFLALQTGLRFAETAVARSQVNRERGEIVIEKPKGGSGRAFAIRIYPEIAPMIDAWLTTKAQVLWSLPPQEREFASLVWTKFFRELGLGHLCFHCTRVTFISRGARAGIPEAMMMKLVNHASIEVHRVYQRLAEDDALRFRARIAIPTGDDATV